MKARKRGSQRSATAAMDTTMRRNTVLLGLKTASSAPIPQGKGSLMATVFRGYSEFRNATLACPKCAWSGQGRQTEVGEVFEDGMVSEYHCPKCSEYLAVAPWPRIGESRE